MLEKVRKMHQQKNVNFILDRKCLDDRCQYFAFFMVTRYQTHSVSLRSMSSVPRLRILKFPLLYMAQSEFAQQRFQDLSHVYASPFALLPLEHERSLDRTWGQEGHRCRIVAVNPLSF